MIYECRVNLKNKRKDDLILYIEEALQTIQKQEKVIELMSKSILNYDDQLVINQYRDTEHVKETFTEYAMKEDK